MLKVIDWVVICGRKQSNEEPRKEWLQPFKEVRLLVGDYLSSLEGRSVGWVNLMKAKGRISLQPGKICTPYVVTIEWSREALNPRAGAGVGGKWCYVDYC